MQSDLDKFQFDFMFVKPHEVPPLLYANVQTEMGFGVEQFLFTTPTLWKQELFYSKSHYAAMQLLYIHNKEKTQCGYATLGNTGQEMIGLNNVLHAAAPGLGQSYGWPSSRGVILRKTGKSFR